MLSATIGSSSSTSAVSFAARGRNDANSTTPSASPCETRGQATTDEGAADPSPDEMPR